MVQGSTKQPRITSQQRNARVGSIRCWTEHLSTNQTTSYIIHYLANIIYYTLCI